MDSAHGRLWGTSNNVSWLLVQSRFAETRFAETLTLTLNPNP